MNNNHYLRQLLEKQQGLEKGLYVAHIAHDEWCNLLKNNGSCNCSPIVEHEKITDPARIIEIFGK